MVAARGTRNTHALGASTPAAEASTENVAIAEKVGAAAPPAVTLEPVHSVTSRLREPHRAGSGDALSQQRRNRNAHQAITLASAPNEGVATAEAHAEHAVVGQQPAHLLAAEPSATPLTPSRTLVSHPQPAPPVVSTSGTLLLTGELPEPSEEKAPERPTDPAPLPGRLILEWADEIEAEDREDVRPAQPLRRSKRPREPAPWTRPSSSLLRWQRYHG